MRALTCFADVDTIVILCLSGNKDRTRPAPAGTWYDEYVPVADRIVDHYCSKGEFR